MPVIESGCPAIGPPRSLFAPFHRLAAASSAFADRRWRVTLLILSVAGFAANVAHAAPKLFWHDEIYTVLIAGLASVQSIWSVYGSGLDIMPPLNAVLTHGVFAIVDVGPISARLPAMIGVWILTAAVFAMVRARSNALMGFGAMSVASVSGAAVAAYEARGYGLMLGLFALALLAWSEAAAGRRRVWYLPLLALAIAGGIWTHYYSALVIVPIATGELVRLARTRRPDWGVLASMLGAALASLPLYPLIRLAAAQSGTYFQKASLTQIPISYALVTEGVIGPAAALAIGLAIAVSALVGSSAPVQESEPPRVPIHELAAALMTMLIPVWAIVIGLLLSNAFVPRYAICAVVAYYVGIPLLLARMKGRLAAALVLCAVPAIFLLYSIVDGASSPKFTSTLSYRPLLVRALTKPAPVIVTGTLYLQTWYYAPENIRRRLWYIADPSTALRLVGTDSLERDYLVLRDFYPIGVEEYAAFVKMYRDFYIYDVDALSWLVLRLREEHADIHDLGRELGATLYQVSLR